MDSVSHPSSSSSTTDRRSYDVFLSFRGADTRKNFTGHLFTALDRAGVKTFIDDDELKRGEKISESLFKAIEESRISIPVFSKNYASSKWCLEELAAMVECKKNSGQEILPIFLDVDPSDVRNQTGSFGAAFRQLKHKKPVEDDKVKPWRGPLRRVAQLLKKRVEDDKVKTWSGALREAGQLSGWNLREVANGDESKLIPLVIKEVLQKLSNSSFDVAKYSVGIESRVEDMMGYLQLESDNVLFVGIWGLGGLGKTTIAKAVLNKISCDFKCVCFLPDIREDHSKNGIVALQKKLLRTLDEAYNDITIDGKGESVIKERLHSKKVLLVLDDVDNSKQLDALAGQSDWFGSRSRIIITTRNMHVLQKHQVGLIYKPKELDYDQSLQLFSKHAFFKDQPSVHFMELSKKAVKIAGGLPLALEILGSSLFGMETKEWKDELCKWKKIPSDDFHNRLKLSYDGLDDLVKQIFLDIACFFIGMDKELAITIWEGCRFYPEGGIKVLIHRCLVKIDDNNKLSMHDHIRDMGREIVRQENKTQLEMRSRLWLREEALDVIKKKTGTSKIEGLQVDFRDGWGGRLKLSIEAISLMPNLRLLQVDYAKLEGELEPLPKDLRWLSWKGCPLTCVPTTFHLPELVVLRLKGSKFTQFDCLPQNKMMLEKLKVLDLSNCYNLTSIYNLSGLPCLERLDLENCGKLAEIWVFKGLEALEHLNMRGCRSLKRLLDFSELKSLKKLYLESCEKLSEIQGLEGLEALEILDMSWCRSLERLPDLSKLKSLKKLDLKLCEKLSEIQSLEGLEALKILDMSSCRSLERLPDLSKLKSLEKLYPDFCEKLSEIQGLESLEALKKLHLFNCTSLERLPDLSKLKRLKELNLIKCVKLSEIQGFKGLEALETLVMYKCKSIERLSYLSKMKSLKGLNLEKCEKLAEIQGLNYLEALEELDMYDCTSIERLPDLSKMKSLKRLKLEKCEKLAEIQGLEYLEALESLYLSGCTSIERLPDLSKMKALTTLNLANCRKLSKIELNEKIKSLEVLCLVGCSSSLVNSLKNSLVPGAFECLRLLIFPGNEIPDWFTPLERSHEGEDKVRLYYEVPPSRALLNPKQQRQKHKIIIKGVIMCLVVANQVNGPSIHAGVHVKRNGKYRRVPRFPLPKINQDHVYFHQYFWSWLKEGDKVTFEINNLKVKKAGVHIVYK